MASEQEPLLENVNAISVPKHTLISIPFSHYNEKARWALDYYRIPYTEHRVMPVLHMLSVRYYMTESTRGLRNSNSTFLSTPFLLVGGAGKTPPLGFHDSSDIIQYAISRYSSTSTTGDATEKPDLYHSCGAEAVPRVMELERRYSDGDCVGKHMRRWVYFHLLLSSKGRRSMRSMARRNGVGIFQLLLWNAFFPIIANMMYRNFRVNAETYKQSQEFLAAEFEYTSLLLTPESPYLAGKEFSVADLTWAALVAPLLGVSKEDGYGASMPSFGESFSEEGKVFLQQLRETPAGKHALRMYREHRVKKVKVVGNGRWLGGLW